MARTALKNPRVYDGGALEKDTVRALDGQTWKAGEFGYFDSGYARPVATDGVSVQFLFASTQDTAASSSDVVIERIPSGIRFVGYVGSDTNDTTAQVAHIGGVYGLHVASNVATVNVNEASTTAVYVEDLLWKKEPLKNDSTDSPGQVIFSIRTVVLEA